MELSKGCPRNRNQLRGRIELHGARTQRNHGVGEAQIAVLERLDVAHHFRFRAVAVEHRVVQVIHLPVQGAKERGVKRHPLHWAHTEHRAKRGKVVLVRAFVERHAHVLAVGEVSKVDTLGFGPRTQGLHFVRPSEDFDFQGVRVATAHHVQPIRSAQRHGKATGVGVHPLGDVTQALGAVVHCVHGSHDCKQALGCADVGGRLVPTDVLFPGLQGHAQRLLAHAVHAHADDAAGEMTLERFFGRKEGGVGPTVAHGHPEALGTAHHHVCAHRTRRLQQKHGHQIGRKHSAYAKVCHA